MHRQQQLFCESIRDIFPDRFKQSVVIDFGSMDINGNNRYLFTDCKYTGVDLGRGKNVQAVSKAHEYIPEDIPDIVISTEMLEHDEHWRDSITHMVNVLKCGGLMIVTCATAGRREHGTHKTDKRSSPFTLDYYENVDIREFRRMLPESFFQPERYILEHVGTDLQFWGIKV